MKYLIFIAASIFVFTVANAAQYENTYDDCIQLARAGGAMVEMRDGGVPLAKLQRYVIPNVADTKKQEMDLNVVADYVYKAIDADKEHIIVQIFSSCYKPLKPSK